MLINCFHAFYWSINSNVCNLIYWPINSCHLFYWPINSNVCNLIYWPINSCQLFYWPINSNVCNLIYWPILFSVFFLPKKGSYRLSTHRHVRRPYEFFRWSFLVSRVVPLACFFIEYVKFLLTLDTIDILCLVCSNLCANKIASM